MSKAKPEPNTATPACGCTAYIANGKPRLAFCRLHAAAPRLYGALALAERAVQASARCFLGTGEAPSPEMMGDALNAIRGAREEAQER